MKLRVAIVGCGRMGAFTTERTRGLLADLWFPLSHGDAVAADDGLELVAVCDVNKATAASAAIAFGLDESAGWTDVEAMLGHVRPDIVSIATRSAPRASIIRAAIHAGVKGIHTEKPLCPNLGDAVDILDLMNRRDIAVTYGTLRRYMPSYNLAKRLLLDGAIGGLREIVLHHGVDDLLLWTHPHSVDLMLYYGGVEIESVRAECVPGEVPAADGSLEFDPKVKSATVAFSSGVLGKIAPIGGGKTILIGTKGRIEISSDSAEVVFFGLNGSQTPYTAPTSPSGTAAAFRSLSRAVRSGEPTAITANEIEMNQRILFCIARSGFSGGEAISPLSLPLTMTISGRFGDAYA